jgi:hypothetical protein
MLGANKDLRRAREFSEFLAFLLAQDIKDAFAKQVWRVGAKQRLKVASGMDDL